MHACDSNFVYSAMLCLNGVVLNSRNVLGMRAPVICVHRSIYTNYIATVLDTGIAREILPDGKAVDGVIQMQQEAAT
jgi:hypothetical protein